MTTPSADPGKSDIAIIGFHGRFPGAANTVKLWDNLCAEIESLSRFSEDELREGGVPAQVFSNPNYVPARGILEGIDLFDAHFFGLTHHEAEDMDPQHRLFLECCFQALELAGYAGSGADYSISVFAGASTNTYFLTQFRGAAQEDALQVAIAGSADFLATRVAYKLNLRGPALTIQTACSTSLVAVHLACQSLLDGESDIAIAGGVSVGVPHRTGYMYQAGHILSPDGRCRPFDAAANGTVPGSGVAVLVLKRLFDAVRDRDLVHAVIKGTAINNDGASKVGFTAPSVTGQAAVVSEAIRVAGLEPRDITYIETHGTGTAIGDPIEIRALHDVFGNEGRCAIGSIKSNLGHLDAAAGVTGLIKVILALKHLKIPATAHFERANPELHLEDTPFYVNAHLTDWVADRGPLRAGVSSFGIGGTNAHVIVEQAPARPPSGSSRRFHLLALSAKSRAALEAQARGLADFLEENPTASLADVAYTLGAGRCSFGYRGAVTVRDAAEAMDALRSPGLEKIRLGQVPQRECRAAFLFPGQGSQYAGAAHGIYTGEPVFRDVLDRCANLLRTPMGVDIRELLFAEPSSEAERRLEQTAVTQPCLFAIEYALASLCIDWGIRPVAMMGHSVGELVAACVAGVAPLDKMLELVALRGRLMQEQEPGAMLGVHLSAGEAVKYEHLGVSVAASNSSSLCALSGPFESVLNVEQRLIEEGVIYKRLRTSHAFHSPMMDRAAQLFARAASGVALKPPSIPYISNVTGTWITDAEATSAEYYGKHLRSEVRFSQGLGELLRDAHAIFLEAGPGSALTSLMQSHTAHARQPAIPLIRSHAQEADDVRFLANAAGEFWANGGPISWPRYYRDEQRNRIELPTYPFEHRRYWRTVARHETVKPDREGTLPYTVTWKSTPPAIAVDADGGAETWLILADRAGLAAQIASQLRQRGREAATVSPGEAWSEAGKLDFTLTPSNRADYDHLWRTLRERGFAPTRILFAWAAEGAATGIPRSAERVLVPFEALLYLAQSMPPTGAENPVRLIVATRDAHLITGTETLDTSGALLVGACRVISQELSNVECRVVDLGAAADDGPELAEALLREAASNGDEPLVCLRGPRRWEATVETIETARIQRGPTRLERGGSYVIVGDDFETARVLSDYLRREWRARVGVITSRGLVAAAAGNADSSIAPAPRAARTWSAKLDDGAELQRAMEAAWRELNHINGVFRLSTHAAGNLIQAKTSEQIRSGLRPHVQSLLALEQALEGLQLQCVVLFSSSAGVTGGLGQLDGSTASAFIDACAAEWRYRRGWPAITIAWDPFEWETWPGANLDAAPEMQAQIKQTLEAYGIRREDFETSLDIALRSGLSYVLFSRRDFLKALKDYRGLKLSELLGSMGSGAAPGARHARPDLVTPFVAPRDGTEERIAAIWRELFGLCQVGVDDSFFDLGGSSLLAIQLVARLRQAWGQGVSMDVIFARPTVAQLAEYFAPPPELAPEEMEEVERLMAELAALPEDVRESLLKRNAND